jgi:cytochrome c556
MKRVLLFATALLVAGSVASFAATPDEIIATRQANQKRVGELATAMKKAVEGGATAASQVEAATELSDRTHRLKDYFPVGTETGGNTKAKPEIWSDRAGFDKVDAAYVAAFDKLLVFAKAGDTPGFNAQFAEGGSTCGACHRAYRAR